VKVADYLVETGGWRAMLPELVSVVESRRLPLDRASLPRQCRDAPTLTAMTNFNRHLLYSQYLSATILFPHHHSRSWLAKGSVRVWQHKLEPATTVGLGASHRRHFCQDS